MSENLSSLSPLLRGVSELITEKELQEKLNKKKSLRVKLGVDPTSPDLHLGHTVVLNKLKCFQEMGHTIIFIIGDFTARIGDPSGQSATRPRLSGEQIAANAKTYQEQVFKILDRDRTEVRFNSEWFKNIGAEGILELGFRYTTQRLMERDDFSKRLKEEKPIALAELYYPLLQGYDSVAVQSDLEIGGTDQKFNLLVGRELQRDFGQEPQAVMTLPILVGMDGVRKMSKSYQNAIALNDSPKEMFGKIMSVSDDLMWQYYELLTLENLSQVKKLHPKEAKMKLASQITELYHAGQGEETSQEFEKVFSKKDAPETMEEYRVSKEKLQISHLLFESGLSPSKNESKRLIENGGVRINSQQVASDMEISVEKPFILQVGKRKFKRILPPL
ncbi:MAG: tyrosine--tRNA ligase [Elusimicrobia bacterium]|nr:tyrosine--tRNA ligase [Elusimicrobiota bacterium]